MLKNGGMDNIHQINVNTKKTGYDSGMLKKYN